MKLALSLFLLNLSASASVAAKRNPSSLSRQLQPDSEEGDSADFPVEEDSEDNNDIMILEQDILSVATSNATADSSTASVEFILPAQSFNATW